MSKPREFWIRDEDAWNLSAYTSERKAVQSGKEKDVYIHVIDRESFDKLAEALRVFAKQEKRDEGGNTEYERTDPAYCEAYDMIIEGAREVLKSLGLWEGE